MSSSTVNEPESHLSAVPDPQEASPAAEEAANTPSVADPAPEEPEDDRVARPLFLLVLLGFLICAIGFGVQSQRVGSFQAEIGLLEGEVLGLGSELERANARVLGFEAQRQQIQQSLQRIIEEVLALEVVVSSDPASAAPRNDAAEAAPLP